MISFWRTSHWGYRALFLAMALLLLFVRLLPLGSSPGTLPGPDLLLCLIFAWVIRRPDFLPVGLIVMVVLAEDMLLQRPPGLWTALVVVASEFFRSRSALTRELHFATEWLLVVGMMVMMLLAYRLVFTIAVLPQPPFGFSVIQVMWSALAYLFVAVFSRPLLDLHRPATGDTEGYGRPR